MNASFEKEPMNYVRKKKQKSFYVCTRLSIIVYLGKSSSKLAHKFVLTHRLKSAVKLFPLLFNFYLIHIELE